LKKIVIVAGYVYPDASPTGKIALQFADMLKADYDVSIVFIQTSLDRIDGVKHNGMTFYAIYNVRLYCEHYFIEKAKSSSSKILGQIFSVASKIVKAFGRINAWFFFPRTKCYSLWPNNLSWFYPKAYRKLVRLHQENKLDVVFTVNSPFPAHLAGRKFKYKFPDVHWVTYTVDPYARAHDFTKTWLLPTLKAKIDKGEEKCIYNLADYNFVSEEVFSTESKLFDQALNKTVALPYLLVPVNEISYSSIFSKNKINLVYAGRFYETIRNPEYLLKTFLAIDNPDILLHLYTVSDCDSLIDSYVNRSNGRIIRHETVSVDKVSGVLSQADILISVGNSTASFKPSKIFEYIATCKPIVHFYQNGLKDNVLINYLAVLQIDQAKLHPKLNSKIVEDFCYRNKNTNINWQDVIRKYQKHSIKSIKSLILKGINISNQSSQT